MLAMAAGLDAMIRLDVSGWVQLLLAGFGVYLIVMAWFSLRFDRRRAAVLESGTPQPVTFEINRTTDRQSAAFLAEVRIGEEVWVTPLRISVGSFGGFNADVGMDGILSQTVDVQIDTPALLVDGLELLVERGEHERLPILKHPLRTAEATDPTPAPTPSP